MTYMLCNNHTSLNPVICLIVSNTPEWMWSNKTESSVILQAKKWSNFVWCNGHSDENKTVQKFNRQNIIPVKYSPFEVVLCLALIPDGQRFYIGGVECFHFSAWHDMHGGHVQV